MRARRGRPAIFQIDPLVGHAGDGFVLVAREVEFLDAAWRRRRSRDGTMMVVVKILGPVTHNHTADVERHLRA